MTHVMIADRLIDNGFKAFEVGGAVRDIFLNRKAKDVDISTDATPDEILALFPGSKRVGAHFPVILVDGIEVATFRTETARGRHDVDFKLVDTIEEDLSRRDFTMNAMAVNMATGEIVDPFRGEEDLIMGTIRFVGDPKSRIIEDPVRMLRAIRFAGTLNINLKDETLRTIHENRHLINDVSNERIRMEFEKMIMSDNPRKAMTFLNASGLMKEILPEVAATFKVGQNRHHGEDVWMHLLGSLEAAATMNGTDDLSLRLAAFFHDIGKVATKRFSTDKNDFTFLGHEVVSGKMTRKIMNRMRFDNLTTNRVVFLVEQHMFFFTDDTRLSRIKVRMVEAEKFGLNIRDIMRIRLADRKGNLAKRTRAKITRSFKKTLKNIRHVEATDAALKVTDLEINGHDLMEMGFFGPEIGKVLRAALEEVIEDRMPNDEEALVAFALSFM